MDLEIVKTDTPQRDLLLLADESEESVADYADRGTTYVARRDGEILGQYVFLHTRPFTAEVVNIAVVPEHQRKGIATAMLRHAVATARAAGFHLLEIGTGDLGVGQIALYERCGFVRCGIDVDYFSKHYPVPRMPQAQRRLPALLRLPAGCAARQGQPRGTQDNGL